MPRLLDLFCGAGGAAMGYHRAGFDEIVGVDIKPQPRYPFTFVQGDALEYVRSHGREFDVIHASPPCQGYSIMRNLPWLRHKEYPKLIEPVMDLLRETGRPFVLENVMGAKLDAGWLCGQMFGLPFFRHRFFASSELWLRPMHPKHVGTVRNGRTLGSRARDIVAMGNGQAEVDSRGARTWPGRRDHLAGSGVVINGARKPGANVGHAAGVALARTVMGCEWMSRDELTQAIPPAYTEFIGKQLLTVLKGDAHA